jgi:serine protease Do
MFNLRPAKIVARAICIALVGGIVFADASAGLANDQSAVERLKKIQQRVQNVVAKAMPACVVVSDGIGSGSGVIVSKSGLILSAGHVMTSNGIYEIILPSGKVVKAKPLGKNLTIDAGMLQIIEPNPAGWPYVEIETAQKLRNGQWVVSMGHSGGFEIGRTPPVRTGRVISVSADMIVSDAVLIGGDSGGPLFNLNGKLIGIHSSIGDTVAENRHVTMPAFSRSWDRMKAGETWGDLPELESPIDQKRRGVIGVRLDLSSPKCKIRLVNDRSPAAEAGVEVGDVVVSFENVQIIDGRHLIEVIKRYHAGDICKMKILREASVIEVEVQLR